jgi:ubiquinone/menaquinone biosynthesis C-methylase UbiE
MPTDLIDRYAMTFARTSWLRSFSARIDQPELLDQGHGTAEDVAANLAEMWRINRMLGGMRALTQHLYPRLINAQEPVRIIDLGTGSADIPAAIVAWMYARNKSASIIPLDWSARNLAIAGSRVNGVRSINLLQGDAMRLPFAHDSIDFVIATLMLHHFDVQQAIPLLRNAYAVARRAIIISDLVRGWLPYLAFKVAQPLFARNYLTRCDGALSIRRAYTPRELRALAKAAGLSQARVYTHFPWRMTLVADKAPAGDPP